MDEYMNNITEKTRGNGGPTMYRTTTRCR